MSQPQAAGGPTNVLSQILERTRATNRRRERRMPGLGDERAPHAERFGDDEVVARLRRAPGASVGVIAEVKFRSPSAGAIRPWSVGEAIRVAREYESAGAKAVSALADGPGFGGSPLMVRRCANAVDVPVLFKGFVLERSQLRLAHHMGARMVLLLVRAMPADALRAMVDDALRFGLEPVVEAADDAELKTALRTPARVVGVNARDLRTFRVDPAAAARLVESIPRERVAVTMSGIRSANDLARIDSGRADVALVGEGLMRAASPGDSLRHWLETLSE